MLPYERQGRFYFFSNCPFYQELTLLQIFTASFPSGFIAQSRVTYLIFNQLLAKGNSTIAGTLSVLFIVVFLESEKAMAPHSSTLAWKIPWTEEPGRLQSMGSLRVRHDWATSLSLFTFLHWRRKWQPTPVFLPVESQGRGTLVGCRLWGHTESDTTEAT